MNLSAMLPRLSRRGSAGFCVGGLRVAFTVAFVLLSAVDVSGAATPDKKAKNVSAPVPVAAASPPIPDAEKPDDLPGADYVPCRLTLAQLRMLQRPEITQTLSPADVEKLQSTVLDAAVKASPDPAMTGPWMSDLIVDLGSSTTAARLAGLAPSQALAVIVDVVRTNRDKLVSEADAAWYERILREAVAPAGTDDSNTPASAVRGPRYYPSYMYRDYPNSEGEKAATATGTEIAAQKTAKEGTALEELFDGVRKLSDGTRKRVELYPHVEELLAKSQINASDKALAAQALQKGRPSDAKNLIDAARQFLVTLERPEDIGCSMSLLTWREVEFAFGYLIANEYIAVQVVVRNLSEKQPFVLHDVEFEVDADPTGRLGRFYSGRDKVVVRALANTQSSGDPRNITMSVATGVGAVMSAAQTVFGGQLADATGVFNSGFIPALKSGWKDLSGEQLKMIDDNTFSSTPSSQTVVPKSGTVVFYTFIPSKQFEEGWWTQPCVETMYEGRLDSGGRLSNLSRGSYGQQTPLEPSTAEGRLGSGGNKKAGALPPGSAAVLTGVDVRRALEVCARLKQAPVRQHSLWSTWWKKGVLLQQTPATDLQTIKTPVEDPDEAPKTSKPPNENQTSEQKIETTEEPMDGQVKGPPNGFNYELFRTAYRRPYRRWSGNSLAIFRELANTVVAGVHTEDLKELLPSIAALDCGAQVNDTGSLDYSKISGDTLNCSLTGKNLSSLPKIRLRNANDAVDAKTAESDVKVVGDPTKATVSWPVATLHGLPGTDYLVYGVTTQGAELKSSAALHLPDLPYGATVANTSKAGTEFDFTQEKSTDKTKQTPQVLTVTGVHLDEVKGLVLSPAVDADLAKQAKEGSAESETKQAGEARKDTAEIIADEKTKTPTQVSFSLKRADVEKLGDGGATLTLKTDDANKEAKLGTKLGITIKLAGAKK